MDTTSPDSQALPSGTHLHEFVIERILGSGGFGITYLARDTGLNRQVVIKENLPSQFAWRETATGTVRPRHSKGGDIEDYEWSMRNFLREAETLASLDHPGIVRVLRKFEANGTGYFVMPFVEGLPFDALTESRCQNERGYSEEELGGLLSRMLEALDYLHARGIYHRDIKPGNILMTNEGIPVLIDFGSARQKLSDHSMTVVESAGYTPFEQLQSQGNIGPWSDLYALGATIVKAITYSALPKANDRIRKDPHVPLAQREDLISRFSLGFLRAIDKATAVNEEDRWQNAGAWLKAMSNGWQGSDENIATEAGEGGQTPKDSPHSPETIMATDSPASPTDASKEIPKVKKSKATGKRKVLFGLTTVLVVGGAFAFLIGKMQQQPDSKEIVTQPAPVTEQSGEITRITNAEENAIDLAAKQEAKAEEMRQQEAEHSRKVAEELRQMEAERLKKVAKLERLAKLEAEQTERIQKERAKREAEIEAEKLAKIKEESINQKTMEPAVVSRPKPTLQFPESEIITRYGLSNTNNHAQALARANQLAKSADELDRTGRDQAKTADFYSALTGRGTSNEHVREKGYKNITKAAGIMRQANAIRDGVSEINSYLHTQAKNPKRSEIHEIASSDNRKISVRIIDPLANGFIVQKTDGEFLLIEEDKLSKDSLQYIYKLLNARDRD